MLSKFKSLKQKYDEYYSERLKSGKLLVKDTEKGIWGYSGAEEVFELFKKINLHKHKNFLDLGSGDGKIVLIASLFGIKATGIEYDQDLHNNAVKIRDELGLKAEFIQGDYMQHDFSKYGIIFINPDKGFHHGVEDKLLKELKGVLFVYNTIFQPRFLKKGKTYWINQTPIIKYTLK